MLSTEIFHAMYCRTMQDLINYYNNGQLNLEPGFQRQSVWNKKDREKLIDSILRNYSLPAIFLYKRIENGKVIYDVLDGKQRLESIFYFIGLIKGNRFEIKMQLPESEKMERIDWNYLKRKNLENRITDYHVYTILVDGDLNNIIDLFVRINSTGKALSAAEKQHAKFYNSLFLKTAARIAKKYETYFKENGIVSTGQIARMKHIELICELMISLFEGDVLNKKTALNKVMEKDCYTLIQIRKSQEKTIRAINRVKMMFPDIRTTRFRQISDYYILVCLIANYEADGLILIDRKRNSIAWNLLKTFSLGVDAIREKQKKLQNVNEAEELYRDYLLTVSQATDEVNQRRRRYQILDGLLRSIFEVKDRNRTFSNEQRRLIWHTSEQKTCQHSGCSAVLTWEDFTIDHIDPHSKGGRSILANATLMCRSHNSSKSNKKKASYA